MWCFLPMGHLPTLAWMKIIEGVIELVSRAAV
jgi:hypothetical protein